MYTKGRLAPGTPPNCLHCGVEMIPRPPGQHPANAHAGHGGCRRCLNKTRCRRKLPHESHGGCAGIAAEAWAEREVETGTRNHRWRALDLLEEFEFLRDQGYTTKQQVADRLGIKYKTLDRALTRARAYRRRHAGAGSVDNEGEVAA